MGLFFSPSMPPREPTLKRTVAFIDGQNLFHSAREAFGYTYPNYDINLLAKAVCRTKGWTLLQSRFYTGIPDRRDNARWNQFWAAKLLAMSRSGVHTYTRALRYRNKTVPLPNRPEFGGMAGKEHVFLAGEEKGIDVRIALDVIRMAHRKEYDVALLFSQDQDLSEVADEIRVIASEQDRWLRIACAYPVSPTSRNTRGVNKTDWIEIDRATYDACLDGRDYR